MNRRSYAFTLVEVLVVLAIAAIFFSLISWAFSGFAWLWFLLFFFVWLAIVAGVNKGRVAFGIAMIPVLVCLVGICLMLPTVYPMQLARLRGASYESVPLVTVLWDIAAQKDDHPGWWFFISDHELGEQLVSVEIPDRCSLGHALDLVSEAAGCEYAWGWHKMCGNAPSPACAAIHFVAVGADREDAFDAEIIVDSDGIDYLVKQ